ncbi:MAG: RNA polymerase sigma-70 factor [Bacteroidaceae bacterium]|nr:RNA polymerase sigma-70 factor [Bacteroidaceae bacterium]MBR3625904.1 RNA polymerase sigma-70 factor [Bacteroidaceae bacterium]
MTEQDIRRFLREMSEDSSEQAFRSFYDLTYDRLFRIAYYFVQNHDLAQEAVLDAFMNIWNARSGLLQIANIEDFLFVVTKRAALNTVKKEKRHTSVEAGMDVVDLSEVVDSETSPERILITEELFARYVKALDRLPERNREVFILVREEGLSYAEVAEKLSISENTVDAHLRKATERLHQLLGI